MAGTARWECGQWVHHREANRQDPGRIVGIDYEPSGTQLHVDFGGEISVHDESEFELSQRSEE